MTESLAAPNTPAIGGRAIWIIAVPAMLTNVATALIGIGDMWIVGRLEDAAVQGAVDVGARLFAVLFTVMNFLKTGTTGLVAQAGSRVGASEQAALLIRALFIAMVIAAMLLLAKPVLLPGLLSALGAEARVLEAARIYAEIRYWTAPGVMANLAIIGFLVGQRRMKTVLAVEIGYNLLNVALGLWFVLSLEFGIEGIGWSSFIAEYAKLAMLGAIAMSGLAGRAVITAMRERTVLSWRALRPFIGVNRDLFLRTLVLVVALAALTRLSAERGADVLAANGIIYQLFIFTALLLDGFENAAQVLNGERIGARDRDGFVHYCRAILLRGLGVAVLVAGGFALLGGPIVASFAATPAVAQIAQASAFWLVLIPFAGVASFVLDGVYVGASWTRALLATMAIAAAAYVALLWLTWPMGNNGLWLSFTLFLSLRAVLQLAWMPPLMRRSFPGPTTSGGF